MDNRRVFTIQGNEANGYVVVQLVDGDYEPITKRYPTYEEACDALYEIHPDKEEA